MSYIKKVLIVILLFMIISIPIKATTSTEYKEKIIELRGAWVSTVSNLDIDQQYSIDQYQAQYRNILDNFKKFNMNAVFFQVRPTNDAFYESEINPWSKFLTGVQGKNPGWDPLPWLVEETHKRGMEFHAWLNPYRVSLDVFSSDDLTETQYKDELSAALEHMDDKNFAKKHPDLLIQGDRRILLNPGKPEARQHIFDTIKEIITKYDVDAIHFDDYFYNGVSLSRDRNLYMQTANETDYEAAKHKDWRRLQVDLLVEGISNLINDFNIKNQRHVQFGISPAAGWAPSSKECTPAPNGYGMEEGMEGYPCSGYSSYHDLFADTRKWVKEEWLDYILPQNYFDIARYHEDISRWWNDQVAGTKVKLYMGLPLHRLADNGFPELEISNQLKLNQKYENISGYVLFSYRNLVRLNDRLTVATNELKNKYWTKKSLLPIRLVNDTVQDTKVNNINALRRNKLIEISFDTDDNAIGYLLYRFGINETPIFADLSHYDTINNNNKHIIYQDAVENNDTYKYYLKAVLINGDVSNLIDSVEVSDNFVNKVPVFKDIKISNNIYNGGENIHITANVDDADGDALVATIEFALDGVRYRNKVELVLVNNTINYEYEIPRQITENGKLKVTISDITDSSTVIIDDIIIVDGMDDLQKHMHSALIRFNKKIRSIWS